eukprot:1459749-Amphidinium_carterae.1
MLYIFLVSILPFGVACGCLSLNILERSTILVASACGLSGIIVRLNAPDGEKAEDCTCAAFLASSDTVQSHFNTIL